MLQKALEFAAKYGPKVIDWVKKNWWWLASLAWEAIQWAIEQAAKALGF